MCVYKESLECIEDEDIVLKSRVQSNIGICLYNMSMLEDSIKYFSEAAKADENFSKPFYFLAKIFEQ